MYRTLNLMGREVAMSWRVTSLSREHATEADENKTYTMKAYNSTITEIRRKMLIIKLSIIHLIFAHHFYIKMIFWG